MSGNRKSLSLPGFTAIRKANNDRATSRMHRTQGRPPRFPSFTDGPSSSCTSDKLDSTARESPEQHEAKLSRTLSEHIPTSSMCEGHTESTRLPSINEVLKGVQRDSPAVLRTQSMHKSVSHSNSNMPPLPHHERSKTASKGKRRLYVCSRCTRTFTRKSDASKHERVVHDRVIESQCGLCNRQFTRKDYCYKHIKSIHGVEPKASMCRFPKGNPPPDGDGG